MSEQYVDNVDPAAVTAEDAEPAPPPADPMERLAVAASLLMVALMLLAAAGVGL